MGLIVQKFGGTSVADSQKILAAARKAIRARQAGHQVVMVVSAMGKNTDMLVELAKQINERPPAREMDMLLSTGEQVSVALMAMAMDALGHKAVSLTGAQIGIRTDSRHTKARIRSISTERVQRLLAEGNIVIAAGFQGIDEQWNITTLGRGGSDTTAVALAAVLRADACEIYTDVDGVYTADPRVVPEARCVPRISYDEMLEMASLGAGVMHSRSIEFAKKYGVPIRVRSSMTDAPGTEIGPWPESPDQPVSGAALTRDEARVTLHGVPDRPGASYEIFSRVADRHVAVDMIVQNVGTDGRADVSFTVPAKELPETLEAVEEAVRAVGAERASHDREVSKVSVVGLGMARQTGVAERMFRALAEEGVNIQMISTSEIKISTLVRRDDAQRALRAVHRAFALDQPPAAGEPEAEQGGAPSPLRTADAAEVVAQLQETDMERLLIDGVVLDQDQARVTVHGVPDRPGVAARIFRKVAESGAVVDMIVQSCDQPDGEANLTFTVPRSDAARSAAAVRGLAGQLALRDVTCAPAVAKLSVSGVGLRSHADVATRMFQTLSRERINVDMISTSEVRVNVVVDGQAGPRGLTLLRQAFADAMPAAR